METNSRKLIKLLEADGWREVGVEGSHHHFRHPVKSGKLQVPHPKKDLAFGTARAILQDAGLLNED